MILLGGNDSETFDLAEEIRTESRENLFISSEKSEFFLSSLVIFRNV